MARYFSELSNDEYREISFLLEDVTIVDLEIGSVTSAIIEGHDKVTRIRLRHDNDEAIAWFTKHVGDIVDIRVVPERWETRNRSGTIYHFFGAQVKEHSNAT